MHRLHLVVLFTVVLMIAGRPAIAGTFYVGNCFSPSFGTIGAALASSSVTPGSTIKVCPGYYPEQLTISKAVTLQGIAAFNSNSAVISMPAAGLAPTFSIEFETYTSIAAQVEVTAGPVNFTNITIGGAAGTNCPTIPYVGIFYASGSSGTVNEVETRNQLCNNKGMGILVENGAGAKQSVNIQNSNIHDFSGWGILTCSKQTPTTLAVAITGTYVSPSASSSGLSATNIMSDCNTAATISNNVVNGGAWGIFGIGSSTVSGNTVNNVSNSGIVLEGPGTASGNTVANTSIGVVTAGPGSITSNKIFNSGWAGIALTSGVTSATAISNNSVTKSTNGINFACHLANISGNTITGAATGINAVPAAYTGVNTFFNAITVRTGGC